MIATLRGVVTVLEPDHLILENQGIGYRVFASQNTIQKIQIGEEVHLLIAMQVREDAITLFGFYNEEEKELYHKLLTVSKVGAKLALSILSTYEVGAAQSYIVNGDIAALSKIPGIGKRTAERIVVELKDKIPLQEIGALQQDGSQDSGRSDQNEVVEMLVGLGFSRIESVAAYQKIVTEEEGLNEDAIIKKALRLMSRI